MKKRDVSKTLAVIALVISLLLPLFSNISEGNYTTLPGYTSSIMGSALFSIMIAVVFIFAKNETVKRVGYGMLAIDAFLSLGTMIRSGLSLGNITSILSLVTTILLMVSVLFFFVKAVLAYFGYTPSTDDSKVTDLKAWKKFADEQKISAEDYALVKDLLLKNAANSPVAKELKELKELLANDLIDSSDLAKLKSSL